MLRREESGFTLVELLVAAGLMLVVVGAALALLDSSNTIAARDQERTHAIREAQVGVQSMTRELRQAFSIVSSSPSSIEFHVLRGGGLLDLVHLAIPHRGPRAARRRRPRRDLRLHRHLVGGAATRPVRALRDQR